MMCPPWVSLLDLAVHHNMHWAAGPAHDGRAWPDAALTLWPDGRARDHLEAGEAEALAEVALEMASGWAVYTAQPIPSLEPVTWRHLEKALDCDELQ